MRIKNALLLHVTPSNLYLAPSAVTRVALCVSRVLLDVLQKKRETGETARRLIFSEESLRVKLKFTNLFFFQNSRKLFDLSFSYKHCNFSRVCPLVKMASKTVTRSINDPYSSIEEFTLIVTS